MARSREMTGQGARRLPWLACVALAPLLAGCGPVPVEQAEAQCFRQIAPEPPVSGEAGISMTSSGPRTTAKVRLNLGLRTQGDPSAAYDRCVYQRSGRMPTRPLYARTDWRG